MEPPKPKDGRLSGEWHRFRATNWRNQIGLVLMWGSGLVFLGYAVYAVYEIFIDIANTATQSDTGTHVVVSTLIAFSVGALIRGRHH